MEDTLQAFNEGPEPRKKITLISRQQLALKALAENVNGAEAAVLEELTRAVLGGDVLEPIFQSVANAIVAKAICCDKLPLKAKGRPKNTKDDIGWYVAYQYFLLKDAGVSYEKSVADIAAEFHKDERHVMRMVKANKSSIGSTIEARNITRSWFGLMVENHQKAEAAGQETYIDWMIRMVEDREAYDPIERIEQALALALSQSKVTDIK